MKSRLFGRSGLRVSELCLGTMTFGEDWNYGASKEESRRIFDTFLEAGGNFIDTANRYTEGTSETFLGDCIGPVRDSIVLATKYSLRTKRGNINDGGNHRKNLVQSLEGSLKRLQTEYVDVLYVHAWDFTTSADEVMRALDDMVRAGKVLYVAVSDTPAWVISRANAIAELRGWTAFAGVQLEYSLLQRTPERELLPMARALDLAVTAWAPLAGGALTGKYLRENADAKRLAPESKRLSERNTRIAAEVVRIAGETGCAPAHVAVNWVRSQPGVVIPVIGARTAEQMQQNLRTLEYTLSEEHRRQLDEISAIEPGFPHEMLASAAVQDLLFGGMPDALISHRRR